MRLSTSSSSDQCVEPDVTNGAMPPSEPPRRRLLRGRTTQTVLLAGVMVLAMGLVREQEELGLPVSLFWRVKVDWNGCADIVLGGDSRVYCSVAPEPISKVLGARRVLNYGFDANGYCAEYLAGLERVLDPQSPCRSIVLGITPHSLTPNAIRESGYLHELRRQREEADPATERLLARYCPRVLHFFKPMKFRQAIDTAMGRTTKVNYVFYYRWDGYMPGRLIVEDRQRAIDNYIKRFQNNKTCPDAINRLLAAVKDWTRRGIPVYAFRPPTCAQMVELELARSGFDEAAFVAEFEAAGGQWIAVDQVRYHSYDGSHLREDAAEEFSYDLARRIDELRKHSNAAAKPAGSALLAGRP